VRKHEVHFDRELRSLSHDAGHADRTADVDRSGNPQERFLVMRCILGRDVDLHCVPSAKMSHPTSMRYPNLRRTYTDTTRRCYPRRSEDALPGIAIDDFALDDENVEKFWLHGLRPEDVLAVLEQPYTIKRNRAGRRASHIVIGRDGQGRCLAIPVLPTADAATWRPLTAWFCKPSEWAQLPRSR
jgi:hypothetical protein